MKGSTAATLNRPLAGVLISLVLGWPVGALAQDEDYGYGYEYLVAEEKPKEGRTVLFTPKHISVAQLRPALELVNADVEINPGLNLIAARSPDEDELETIRLIVETLDVAPEPQPSVELTAYILATSTGASSPESLPGELEAEIGALEARFSSGTLRLLDSLFLRVGGGSGGRVEGSFPSWSVEGLSGYQFQFESATVSSQDDVLLVRLDGLNFVVTGENPAGVQRAVLATDVDVYAGSKAVVGKATPRGVDDTLILLVAAEVKAPL